MGVGAEQRDEGGGSECVVVYCEREPGEPLTGAEHFGGEGFEGDLARAKEYAQEELGEQFLHEASLDEELGRRSGEAGGSGGDPTSAVEEASRDRGSRG